jgi:hypothetical protein
VDGGSKPAWVKLSQKQARDDGTMPVIPASQEVEVGGLAGQKQKTLF